MKQEFKKILERVGKILVIPGSMVIGFFVAHLYYEHLKEVSSQEHIVKTPISTSVAVNERGELLIIDRESGNYEIYGDSVGNMIFNLYANKIYSTVAEE